MNANLAFWVYAYALTTAAIVIGLRGAWLARKKELVRHRKHMNLACNLILFFVVSYLFKVLFLGREDKSDWSAFHFTVLIIHEGFIFLMLIAGGSARWLAFKFRDTVPQPTAELPEPLQRMRRRHAWLGKATLALALLAVITASVVLQGMFARA